MGTKQQFREQSTYWHINTASLENQSIMKMMYLRFVTENRNLRLV